MGVHGPGRAIDDQHAYGTGKGGKLIPIAAPIARSGAKGRVVHMGRQIMIGQPFLGSGDEVAMLVVAMQHAAAECLQGARDHQTGRSEEHTSELQSLMRISYAVFCLKKKKIRNTQKYTYP